MAHTGNDVLALRDGTSILLLRDGVDGLLLQPSVSAGSSISGGVFSRGRWRSMVDEEERRRQQEIDERERQRTRKIAAKKKAKADAEAARKARVAAELAEIKRNTQAAVANSQTTAAQAAHGITGTLEHLRLSAIAANAARERELARKEAEPKLTYIQTLMKRNREKYGLK